MLHVGEAHGRQINGLNTGHIAEPERMSLPIQDEAAGYLDGFAPTLRSPVILPFRGTFYL